MVMGISALTRQSVIQTMTPKAGSGETADAEPFLVMVLDLTFPIQLAA